MPEIIPRSAWGAKHEDGFGTAPLPAQRLYLHHSVTLAPDVLPPFIDDDVAVRTLEQIGEDRFGRGISYTFAVTPVGRIYEGHGIARQGAHTAGLNSAARAICWVGNYDEDEPTDEMLAATAWLVRHGHAQGWWPARITGGHRDAPGASTACPGRYAYRLIGDINWAAGRAATPPPVVTAPREDDTVHIPIETMLDDTGAQPVFWFRQAAMAEAGAGSAYGAAAWVTVGSTWGASKFTVTALRHDGFVMPLATDLLVPRNEQRAYQLPPETRMVTVEGTTQDARTIPAAAMWTRPRA